MKRFFLAIIAIVLTNNIFGQLSQQVQRFCGSQLDFLEMQRTDPKRYQQFMLYEDLLQNQLLNSRIIPTGIITIPVVVHVVHNTNAQNISDARINEQIQVLNEDFRRVNADGVNTPSAFVSVAGDAQIEFILARLDPSGNTTTGITRTLTSVAGFSHISNNVKTTSTGGHDPWDTQQYLNIWVCNFSDPNLMGYSTFPADFATSPNLDGVVISFNYFGITDTSAPFNKGRTTTHEIGHWLNLRHIWGDSSSCSVDDGVADTPIQSASTSSFHPNCPNFPRMDACTTTSPGIMFMNYMDYSDDGCMNLFTNGQIARMRALFDTQTGIRRNMLINAHCLTNPDSSANFTDRSVTTNETVTSPCNINVQNVTVTDGATLTLQAAGNIDMKEVYVINNSKLILEATGEVTIERDFEVELGSKLDIIK